MKSKQSTGGFYIVNADSTITYPWERRPASAEKRKAQEKPWQPSKPWWRTKPEEDEEPPF